ncbi:MAG: DNA-directed RNA polymerase specialized sigma24 family protein [Planctomycetota bacterium]|jgi:DNA-directed RNA polymerase specialized sigma24 family protein
MRCAVDRGVGGVSQLQRRLLDAFEELPEPKRSALGDRYLGELTPTQLAKRDGLRHSSRP